MSIRVAASAGAAAPYRAVQPDLVIWVKLNIIESVVEFFTEGTGATEQMLLVKSDIMKRISQMRLAEMQQAEPGEGVVVKVQGHGQSFVHAEAVSDFPWVRSAHLAERLPPHVLLDPLQATHHQTSESDIVRSKREVRVIVFWLCRRNDGDIGWRLRDDNQEINAVAGEGFTTERAAREAIANVKNEAPAATVKISDKQPICGVWEEALTLDELASDVAIALIADPGNHLRGRWPAERPHASPKPNRSASSATAADAVRTTQYRLSSMPRLMLPASLRLRFES